MTRKKQFNVTLPTECAEWLDKQIQSRLYHNPSHAVECLILKAMKNEGVDKE